MLDNFPFWLVWIFLFCGAMVRGQATYWLGRGATRGLEHHRRQHLFERGKDIIERLGVVAVPLAYLTVGIQSAVLFAAGVMKMRPAVFALAQIPGSMAWATIYSTIGFAAWEALAGSWWAILAIAVLVAIGGAWWYRRQQRGEAAEAGVSAGVGVGENVRL